MFLEEHVSILNLNSSASIKASPWGKPVKIQYTTDISQLLILQIVRINIARVFACSLFDHAFQYQREPGMKKFSVRYFPTSGCQNNFADIG
jgi:hypothetical protein